MKNVTTLLALLITVFSFAQERKGERKVKLDYSDPAYIEKLLEEKAYEFPNKTEFSLAIIKNDEVDFYGFVKEQDSVIAVQNQNAIFEVGSISKVFTSTLLADLITRKKVKSQDLISKKLPFKLNDSVNFTYEELATHTSGLPRLPVNMMALKVDMSNPYLIYTNELLEDYLKNSVVLTEKGKYAYSNTGAGLLGYTIEKIEKKPYEEILKKRIFSVYGMKNSTSQRENVTNRLVEPLDYRGNVTSNWDFKALAGAGAILSSTEDLTKFLAAHLSQKHKKLNLTREKTVTVNERLSLGLGWHIIKDKEGKNIYWHNGATGGYTTSMILDMENKQAIVLLTNISGLSPRNGEADKITHMILKHLNTINKK
ncbi:serine hydrolase domain-containing protein [Aureivirga marina]|uniref:serine hydrolase domain-containing protein n=1 Tax=Aureivirga marina TaxID=1182451 RepID=UPI0018C9A4AD|nr:serine hydrolase domain-containing protein [Aureivirga marina]